MDYKVVVVGSSQVGKSCLCNVLVRNTFLTQSVYVPTMVDFYRKIVHIEGERCLLEVIDTAGGDLFSSVTEDQLRRSDGFLCVFGVNDMYFEETSSFIKKIRLAKDNAAILLVGNKCDEQTERVVDLVLANARASYFGVPYMETSALNDVNVQAAFLG